tara:strand:+ start:1869 stop:2507 length:639 start_codon:yes stop_codon:yes gene_type:complete
MKNSPKIKKLVEQSNNLMNNNKWDDAIKVLRELLKEFPSSTPLLTNLSLCLAHTSSFKEAHKLIDQADELEPLNVNTKYVKAFCYEAEENFDLALEGYKRCLKIDKNHYDSWIKSAAICRRKNDLDQALNILEHIFKNIKKTPELLTDIGVVLYEKGDLENSEKFLNESLTVKNLSEIIAKQFLSKIYHQNPKKKELAIKIDKEIEGLIELT